MSDAVLLMPSAPTTNQSPEAAAVCQALMRSPYRHLHRLACDLEDGELVLRGIVCSYYLKQLAQEVALKVAGCRPLRNDVEVLG